MSQLDLQAIAERALGLMLAQGFEHAQASARLTQLTELNIELNRPSLLRSTETQRLGLLGLVGGRKAATELSDLSEHALREAVAARADAARRRHSSTARAVMAVRRWVRRARLWAERER